MKIYSLTDMGKKRKENQDNFWISRLNINGEEACALCLCDGMGGLDSGERASHLVVEAVRNFFTKDVSLPNLKEIIHNKNSEIYQAGRDEGITMGTTCTAAIFLNNQCKVLHVGDSRLYKWSSNGVIKQITTDHSALQKYGVTLQSNPELFKKYKNMLTRCIGVKPEVVIDSYIETYSSGDRFLVCSDGFWHYFKEEDLGKPWRIQDLRSLVDECMQSGELDNITVAVLEV